MTGADPNRLIVPDRGLVGLEGFLFVCLFLTFLISLSS